MGKMAVRGLGQPANKRCLVVHPPGHRRSRLVNERCLVAHLACAPVVHEWRAFSRFLGQRGSDDPEQQPAPEQRGSDDAEQQPAPGQRGSGDPEQQLALEPKYAFARTLSAGLRWQMSWPLDVRAWPPTAQTLFGW